MVVLDTVRGVWRLRDELHPSRVVDDLLPLISQQRQPGFTLICLHHERKAEGEAITDRFAGINALSAMFDMLISLAPKGEDGLLLTYEGRTSKGGSLLLQWKGDEACATWARQTSWSSERSRNGWRASSTARAECSPRKRSGKSWASHVRRFHT